MSGFRRGRVVLSFIVMTALAAYAPASALGVSAASSPDDYPPGVSLPGSPVHGSLNAYASEATRDYWDVYNVYLEEGEVFEATCAVPAGAQWSLMLWSAAEPESNVLEDDGARGNICYLVPEGGSGTYCIAVNDGVGESVGGPYTLTWSINPGPVKRLWGSDRYDTAGTLSRSTHSDAATAAVIVTGTGFADALSASALAGALDAPILLTSRDKLSNDTQDELRRLGVSKVYVVGGEQAISAAVWRYLTESDDRNPGLDLDGVRLWGTDRYQTARAVANEVARLTGAPDGVFVVNGRSFADALAVAPCAYATGRPIMLTPGDSLSGSVSAVLDDYDVNDVIIVGGEKAVSSHVASAIDALNGGAVQVTRIQGVDRYFTAAAVADHAIDQGWLTAKHVGVATGVNFPDALAGGASIGRLGGPLLLTRSSVLSPGAHDFVATHAAEVDEVLVFGGTGAVSSGVYNSIKALLP